MTERPKTRLSFAVRAKDLQMRSFFYHCNEIIVYPSYKITQFSNCETYIENSIISLLNRCKKKLYTFVFYPIPYPFVVLYIYIYYLNRIIIVYCAYGAYNTVSRRYIDVNTYEINVRQIYCTYGRFLYDTIK